MMLPIRSLVLRSPGKSSCVSREPGEASREGQIMLPGAKELVVIIRFTRICQSSSTAATGRQSYDEALPAETLRVSWCGSWVSVWFLDTTGSGSSRFSFLHLGSLWLLSSIQLQVLSPPPWTSDAPLVFSPAPAVLSLSQPCERCHRVARCR